MRRRLPKEARGSAAWAGVMTGENKERLRFVLLFALLSCLVVLRPAHGQEREHLRVSTLFIGSSLLPFWVAQEQGIFNRAGLDVELIWMQSGLSTSALLAREVDAIFGTPQVTLTTLAAKNPPPLIAIAAWGSASEHWLVVDSSVRSVKDWRTKRLLRAAQNRPTTVTVSLSWSDQEWTPSGLHFFRRVDRGEGWLRCNRVESAAACSTATIR